MTNFEYYKEQIWDIVMNNNSVAVTNGRPEKCQGRSCTTCDLDHGDRKCNTHRYEWLYSEHIERPTITKKEKAFLDLCKTDCYIARDMNGSLYSYYGMPIKDNKMWQSTTCSDILNLTLHANATFNIGDDIFSFIKWEDEEPWKVEDLLKLEVK